MNIVHVTLERKPTQQSFVGKIFILVGAFLCMLPILLGALIMVGSRDWS